MLKFHGSWPLWLLVRALERFQSCGAHVVSFGLVALADTSQEMTPVERKLVSLATDGLHLREISELVSCSPACSASK